MRIDVSLLREALTKQNELLSTKYWNCEILQLSPPILWFGNSDKKDKVATVGANPSRREFLDGRDGRYLKGPKQRFHHLQTHNIQEVLGDERTLRLIVDSYNAYFHQNPYRVWFGKPGGSKVEGFLNGLGASLYETKPIGAVHTDLIPIPTMSDFSKLDDRMLKRDFFHNKWAKNFFEKLMHFLDPSAIIVFGRTNAEYFDRHFQRIILNKAFKAKGNQKAKYGIASFRLPRRTIPLVGLSVNLGNPIGFTREMLNDFGAHIWREIYASDFSYS